VSEFRLRKSEKLCDKLTISKVFASGKFLREYPIAAHFLEGEHEDEFIKVLFSVPKKKFKNAVKRNRLKRQMREAYRLHKSKLIEVFKNRNTSLSLVIIWNKSEILPYSVIEKKIIAILARLSEMHEKNIR